jgi:hypothetical protein
MLWATANDGQAEPGRHICEMSPLCGSAITAGDRALWLARLRRDFPDWAFLFDPWARVWVAVQGRYRIQIAATANALHESLVHPQSVRSEINDAAARTNAGSNGQCE